MSGERSGGKESQHSFETQADVDSIKSVLEVWSKPRSNPDVRFINISAAIAGAIDDSPIFREALEYIVDFHNNPAQLNGGKLVETGFMSSDSRKRTYPIPYPQYGANKIHRGFWHPWRKHKNYFGWPQDFDTRKHCDDAVHRVIEDEAMLDELVENVAWRPVQTSYPDRILAPLMYAQAYQESLGGSLRMLSVGHSLGTGEKMLALNSSFPVPEVFDWHNDQRYYPSTHLKKAPVLTAELGVKLEPEQRPTLDFVYGIDVFPGDLDKAAREWAVSSFTPREQMNQEFMDQIEELNNSRPKGYKSLQGDYSNLEDVKMVAANMPQKPNLIHFGTVWYQLPSEVKKAMLRNSLEILDDNGVITLLDFAKHRAALPDSLADPVDEMYFPANWSKWSYRLHVLVPSKWDSIENSHFEPVMHFDTGRCKSVIFTDDFKQQYFA